MDIVENKEVENVKCRDVMAHLHKFTEGLSFYKYKTNRFTSDATISGCFYLLDKDLGGGENKFFNIEQRKEVNLPQIPMKHN